MQRNFLPAFFAMLIYWPTCSSGADGITVSSGLDYSSGKYGQASDTSTWVVPFLFKYASGPLILKLNVPWIHSTGLVNVDTGTSVITTRRTEEGFGDPVVSASYDILQGHDYGVDLGFKAKFATTSHSKTLLTTGENDYSLQAEGYRTFGRVSAMGTLGWTKKGDPSNTDFRDPWYLSLGLAYAFDNASSAGVFYDYRQKVVALGAPRRELTGYVAHRVNEHWKLQVYAVTGFSDASPDYGVGTLLGYVF